jgi:hypothetical protein
MAFSTPHEAGTRNQLEQRPRAHSQGEIRLEGSLEPVGASRQRKERQATDVRMCAAEGAFERKPRTAQDGSTAPLAEVRFWHIPDMPTPSANVSLG